MIDMEKIEQAVSSVAEGRNLRENLIFLLGLDTRAEREFLYSKAYEVKKHFVGQKVHFRGIIEFSNICRKDCYYCGVRKSNHNVKRYEMTEDEALREARWAFENRFGSVVIQAGERTDSKFISMIERLIKRIKEESQGTLGITLSLGEQEKETYQRWFEAGAHRYLLRIESSNRELYSKLHPKDHSYDRRIECLKDIKDAGYHTGTGVMIGLPFQTLEHLAEDLLFFKEIDVDMIGMGPYIVHKDTPLSSEMPEFDDIKESQFELALKMIACARILLKDINIASTTALQALNPSGRELGLLAGANIIMPNITDAGFRPYYQLYDNKPCIDEGTGDCNACLQNRIAFIGETIGYNEWGDSKHFKKPAQKI